MLDELLSDPRVGKSTPVSMALVLRLASSLLARRDLDPIARGALRLIELAAADAFAASLGEELAGSTSTGESKRRAVELWALAGVPAEVVVEADADHAPLTPSDATLAEPKRTAEQIGDALLHLRWRARRNVMAVTQRLVQGVVIDRLNRIAMMLSDPGVDRAQTVRSVAESLVPDVGGLPDDALVERCLAGLASNHDKWEPLAELFSLSTAPVEPASIRRNYDRYCADVSSE